MQSYVVRRYKDPARRAAVLQSFEVPDPDPDVLAALYQDRQPEEEQAKPAAKPGITDPVEVSTDELPEGATRRWARGQQRNIISRLSDALESTGTDPADFLPPSAQSNMRALLPLLRDPNLSYDDMITALQEQGIGADQYSLPRLVSRITDRLIANTPAEQIPEDLSLKPEGPVLQERTNHAAAPIKAMAREAGITYEAIATAIGKSQDAINAFMNGVNYPRPNEILIPLCKMLGLSDEETADYVAAYIPERQAHTTRRRA
jgi:hypothetical protein